MPFPPSDRVIYENNPLVKVICQFRFPPILKIDSEIPADFQSLLSEHFPLYEEKQELHTELVFSQNALQLPQNQISKNHEFSSEDNKTKINLTRTFLAISTESYRCWEDFNVLLKETLRALVQAYKPPFFTRLGIRYFDVIDRQKLNLTTSEWGELLNSSLLGLTNSDISNFIESFENVYIINIPDSTHQLRLFTSFVKDPSNNEICYQIDSDFYNPIKFKIEETDIILESLHDSASRLIRWAITPKLHEAMKPTTINKTHV